MDGEGERGALRGLTVERWAHGGDGVVFPSDGPLQGAVVFVRGVVPGDVVDVRVVKRKRRWARAEVTRVVTESARRVASPCPVLDRCGGCPWLLGDGEAQATSRLAILRGEARKTLGWDEETASERVGLAPAPPDATELGYRVRARFAYRRFGGDHVSLGFRGHRSAELVDVARCAVAHPAVNAALPALRRALVAGEGGDPGGSGAVVVLTDGERVAAWILPDDAHDGYAAPGFAPPEDGTLEPRAFAQANPPVVRAIEAHVTRLAREVGAAHAVELFAGSGALTPALWAAGLAVTAYELDPRAQAGFHARRAALGVAPERGRWHQADLLGIGAPLPAPERAPGLVLLDPPRAGAAPIMPWVRGARAPVIIVSCDVATAMRDLAVLCEGGAYEVLEITGYDMFPQTGHQEVVAFAVAKAGRGASSAGEMAETTESS